MCVGEGVIYSVVVVVVVVGELIDLTDYRREREREKERTSSPVLNSIQSCTVRTPTPVHMS